MKINQLKAGAILSYGQMALGIIINLIYTPVMIRILGQSEYGLYQTAMSVISMLSVLSLGFNSSYVRYYAKYKAEGNQEAIYKLNGLLTLVLSLLGLVALACGVFLAFNLELVFDSGLTSAEYDIARVLMILLAVNLAISFPASILTSIISANERFVFLKILGMAKTVLGPLVTLPLLLLGYRSVAMVAVTISVSMFTDLCYLYYVRNKLKNRFVFHGFEHGLLGDMALYTCFIAANLIIDQVNWNISKIFLGRFHGTTAVSVYAVGHTLFTYYMMLSTSISGVFTPRVHSLINSYREPALLRTELTALFTKVGRIQFLILALVASGIVFFGREFIAFWAGKGYERSYYVLMLLAIPASIPLIQNLGIEIQRAMNKHKFRSVCYAFMAGLNVILSIMLCRSLSSVGGAMSTAISMLIANGLIMNIYYHRRCSIDIVSFWKSILRLSLGILAPVIFGTGLKIIFLFDSIPSLCLGILSYTLVYCLSMWFVGMNDYERRLVTTLLRRVFSR